MSGGLTAPEVRAGGVTLAATGAVVAILGLLQQVAGLFELKPVINVLIIVGAFFLTLAVSVLKQRTDRERNLKAALRCWPLPRMDAADPYRLGVFPLKRDLQDTPEARYVSRGRIDDRLKEALLAANAARPSFILVYGPPRAGKSRTAFKVASDALGEALVVAPRNAEGLRQLAELDPPVFSRRSRAPRWPRSSKAILWLDDLTRYLNVLDANTLEALQSATPPVTLIATIREDDYDVALTGSGSEADAGKAVVAAGQAFGLSDDGLGVRLASSGKEEQAPARPEDKRQSGKTRRKDLGALMRLRRWQVANVDWLFSLPALLALAAFALIGLIGFSSGLEEPAPLSLSEQADQAVREAGTEVLPPEKVDLHGTGQKSWIFAVRPESDGGGRGGSAPPSDEIRIYDQRGEELKERFRFQPDVPGAVFAYRGTPELGGVARLVGGYGFPDQSLRALLPFIVYWDAGAGQYKIASLQQQPPQPSPEVKPTRAAGAYLRDYRKQLTLRDTDQDPAITGYRVQDFAITREPDRLVTALAVDPRTETEPGRVEVQGSILSVSGSGPTVTPCRFEDQRPIEGSWSPSRDLQFELVEPWEHYIKNRYCLPAS